jgi:hypothetical protein
MLAHLEDAGRAGAEWELAAGGVTEGGAAGLSEFAIKRPGMRSHARLAPASPGRSQLQCRIWAHAGALRRRCGFYGRRKGWAWGAAGSPEAVAGRWPVTFATPAGPGRGEAQARFWHDPGR